MANQPFISIIITTYNNPHALAEILKAFQWQSCTNFEVIIADDGSLPTTREVYSYFRNSASFPIRYIWQPDEGFQAAKIRNKAVALAKGDYLIFLDGDCIPSAHFIKQHQKLAEKNFFVAGNRVLLTQSFSKAVLESGLPIYQWSFLTWLKLRCLNKTNRLFPLVSFPLGSLRKLRPKRWQGVKTCNLGVWRTDFLKINGFEEQFHGWGLEDSDLIIRLLRIDVHRKDGHCKIPVFHLWHAEHSRSFFEKNLEIFKTTFNSGKIQAIQGIQQYL